MRNKHKKFALVLSCISAVASCTVSCQNKSNTYSVPGNETSTTTTAVETDVTSVARITTATTTPKVTTAKTTKELEVTTMTKVETAYIAEAVDTVKVTEIVQQQPVIAVTTTTTAVQVEIPQTTTVVEPVAIDNIVQAEQQPKQIEEEVIELEQEVSAKYLNNFEQSPSSYVIQYGDCLWTISEATGYSVDDIMSMNLLVDWTIIQPGDVINLPTSASYVDGGVYTIVSGDCLSLIAEKMGYTQFEIMTSNPQIDWDTIQPGEVVYAPMYVSFEDTPQVAEEPTIAETEVIEVVTEAMAEEAPIVTETEAVVPVEVPVTVEVEATTENSEEVTVQPIAENAEVEAAEEEVSANNNEVVINQSSKSVEEEPEKTTDEVEAEIKNATDETKELANADSEQTEEHHESSTRTVKISYFYGQTYTSDPGSINNITRACNELNGVVVPGYGTFSWFGYVGSCLDYEPAVVMDDNYVPTPEAPLPMASGGGICFPSTILRNAAEGLVGIENILEAHDHTKNGVAVDMSYASVGHQASLNYPDMDLKFRNPYPDDIIIHAKFSPDTGVCYIAVELVAAE